MQSERTLTLADTSRLQLPPDLLAELQRRGPVRSHDFKVDGWKVSFFGRLMARLTGDKSSR